MKNYFVILPHAGAIRSNYNKIERYVSKNYEVVYIDYSSCVNGCSNNFCEGLKSVRQYLSKAIVRKNAEVVFFAHSMGSCILQTLEYDLVEEYFVKLFIHSDGDVIANIKDSNFRNMSQGEVHKIFDEEYDIPDKIRSNKDLNDYFERKLLVDLKILDMIPSYLQNFGCPKHSDEIVHKVLISTVFSFLEHKKEWLNAYPFLRDRDFYRVPGDHYFILEGFDATYMGLD